MEKSIVRVSMRDDNNYDCSYAIITKEKNKIQKSIIVILKELDLRFLLLKNMIVVTML